MAIARPRKKEAVHVTLLGSEEVGKSALLTQLKNGAFSPEYIPTVGMLFHVCEVQGEHTDLKFSFYDVSGKRKYAPCSMMYVAPSQNNLVVFVLDRSKSLSQQKCDLMAHKERLAGIPATYLLAITKSDEDLKAKVTEVEIRSLREALGVDVDNQVICSAQSKAGIPEFKALLLKRAEQRCQPALNDDGGLQILQEKFDWAIQHAKEIFKQNSDFSTAILNLKNQTLTQFSAGRGELTLDDASKIANAAETLVSKLAAPIPIDLLQEGAKEESARTIRLAYVKAFHDATSAEQVPTLKRTSVWRAVLGAVLGAAIGIAVGALVGAALGPGAIATAIACGLKGAWIGAAIGGVSLGATGFGWGLWRGIKNQPLRQVEMAANDYIECKTRR